MNPETELREAPVFTPQPPPPGLGVLRTILLVLMVLVGLAEALLALAAALGFFHGAAISVPLL